MKKVSTQSAFPILLTCVFIMVFVPSASGLFNSIGNLITELTSMKISKLEGVSSGIYITPEDELENCDWRYGFPHKMHWPQLPDFGATGMDVDTSLAILADDFKCTSTGPITDIHFWASFEDDILPINEPNGLTFEIKIYSDIPASADSWSMPGQELWSRTFYPGNYTVREIKNRLSDWFDPLMLAYSNDNHRKAFQYNFCVQKNQFIQEEGTIYWLSIREIKSANDIHKLGWKTTTKKLRWNDNAVYSVPGAPAWLPMYYPKGHEYVGQSIDLSFSITDGMQGDRLHDLGDAPDSSNTFPGTNMLAYTDPNVQANYPTVFWTLFPPYGPIHWQPEQRFYLGEDVSFESGADTGYDEDTNNNLYPPGDLSNRDGADDGIKLPLVLPHCQKAKIPFTLTTLYPTGDNPIYLNVWCDWNRDGDWDDTITCQDGNDVPEWAVQNTAITVNFTGKVNLETPTFLCWHPQTDHNEPDPMWLRISVAEKPWSTSYPTLTGSGGSGPDEGYEYGETEDYLIYPKQDPNATYYELDWADAPDSFLSPAYPTISSNNGAYHVITGPWLGDANDKPDVELDGQPDPNALGDDFDIEPLLSIGIPIDDENGVTIPPLIPGYPADITLEVGGGGGIVQAWIDYDSNMVWEPDEEVYNNYLAPGMHVISFIVRDDAKSGQSFARFRISREGNLGPDGPAKDGEVEDYEVFIEPLSPYTKWLQLPDVTPHGIDIRIDQNDGMRVIADDFLCTNMEKITDVHFWGSWRKDEKYDIMRINLSIYNDDPVTSDNPYSKPKGNILWQKDFYPGQFREKLYHEVRKPGEWWWDLVNDELVEGADKQIWKIDIDIDPNEAFTQQGTLNAPRIYWLAIRVDTNDGEFGWKTRRWPDHFMDDAVWDVGSELPRLWQELRYPKKHPYHDLERNSIDMAFQLTFTQDPGLPTTRPGIATQCSAVQTKCPTQVTQCPPVNTRCPTQATKCPTVKTQCMAVTMCQGSSETQCPVSPTKCPVYTTRCPPSETQCPVVKTTCPHVETLCWQITVCQGSSETYCPALETVCPVVKTECPHVETLCWQITVCQGSSETICPAVYTQCPIEDTQCPSSETVCPPEETVCPVLDTYCPVVDTGCPSPPTECRPVQTQCPPVITKCPEEDTKCPPAETQCPPEPTLCEVIPTKCPVETICPASETKCPLEPTICPSETTKCPIYETRCPTSETKCPVQVTKCPDEPTRCPPAYTQCPANETYCPSYNTYCPPEETRCPEEPTICPPYNTQCPRNNTYCPPSETFCPPEGTKCPESYTKCPATPTECQVVPTQCEPTVCPQIQTQCPPYETECTAPPGTTCPTMYPQEPTRCPVVPTQCEPTVCPSIETQCPPDQCVTTRDPGMETQCPVIETKCPENPTFCPSYYTECPASYTLCQGELTICSTQPTQCPRAITYCPITETQCPPTPTECPYDTYCPVVPTTCPKVLTQCPQDPTGGCSNTDGMTYSNQTIAEEVQKTTVIPAIQSCPAIEVKCPTIIEDKKLMARVHN